MSNELRLNKELFDIRFIKEAISAFSNIAYIECIDEENYWRCVFFRTKVECERVIAEFENYLIALINQKGMSYVSV